MALRAVVVMILSVHVAARLIVSGAVTVMAVLEDAAGHTQHRQSDQSQTSDFHQFPSVRMIPTK
jgi:hypothetical protein